MQSLSRKRVLYGRITEVDYAWRRYGIGKQLYFAAAQVSEEGGFWSMIDMKSADSHKYIKSFGGNIMAGRDGFVYYFVSSERMKQLLRKNELEQAQLENEKGLNLKPSLMGKE